MLGRSLVLSVFLLTSCGAANINKIFGSEDNSYAALLRSAQYAYDEGDFASAEKLANRAYNGAYNNGDAGVLLGNIYLSKAGIDVFQLVGKLSTLSSSSSGSSSSGACKSASGTSQSAGSVLSELSCLLLNLTEADKNALGTNQEFAGLKAINIPSVYIPNEVTAELRDKVGVLGALDKGIRALCPFINRTAVLGMSVDTRHADPSICPDRTTTSFNSAKAHISFALLHLVEALVFQQGVLIDGVTTAENSRTGVQGITTKMSSINTSTPGGISTLASASFDLATVVGKVYDTDNPNSQIALALNGLIMVSQAFEVAGVPPSVTSVITGQLTKLKQTASVLSGANDSEKQSKALSGQITQAYAKQLATKIESTCPNTNTQECSDNQAELCAGFNQLSQGMTADQITKPTICKTSF